MKHSVYCKVSNMLSPIKRQVGGKQSI